MKKENKWINCIMAREDCWEESKFYSEGKGTFFEKQRKEEHLLSYNERGELIRKIEFPEYDEIDTRILIHNSKIYVEVIKKLSGDEEYECTLQCVNYEGEVLCSMKRESFLQDWRILPNGYVDLITMQEHCIVTEDFKEKFCVKGMCMLEPGFIEDRIVFKKDMEEFNVFNLKGEKVGAYYSKDKSIPSGGMVNGPHNTSYLVLEYETVKERMIEIWQVKGAGFEKIMEVTNYTGFFRVCYIEDDIMYLYDWNNCLCINLKEKTINRISLKGTMSSFKGIKSKAGNYYFFTEGKGTTCHLEIFDSFYNPLDVIKYKGEVNEFLKINDNTILLGTYARGKGTNSVYLYEIV